ncbi:hypothetical protein ACFSO0_00675 [Brevibacillus sp. GCM10020057]
MDNMVVNRYAEQEDGIADEILWSRRSRATGRRSGNSSGGRSRIR